MEKLDCRPPFENLLKQWCDRIFLISFTIFFQRTTFSIGLGNVCAQYKVQIVKQSTWKVSLQPLDPQTPSLLPERSTVGGPRMSEWIEKAEAKEVEGAKGHLSTKKKKH